MKRLILFTILLLPLMALSAKETTRVVMRMKVKCTIAKPGMFAEYAERYLGVKEAVTEPSTTYELTDIKLIEQGKEEKEEVLPIDTLIAFDMNCLGEEALLATSIPKMAERAAKQIYQLREARTAIITGDMTAIPDGEAIKAMLNRIDIEEARLVALFIGKKVSYTYHKDFIMTPAQNMTNEVIIRFSTYEGIVEADNMVGEPIYLTLTGKRIIAPTLTEKEKRRVYDYRYVKGSAYLKVNYGDKIEREIYLDEVKQYGADIPVI